MRETIYTKALPVVALNAVIRTANTAVNGSTIDLELYGNRFRAVTFVVLAGVITDGSSAFTVEESPNGSDWTAVSADRIQGSLPTVTDADGDTVFDFGVVPIGQRYLRVVCTTAGATTGGNVGAIALCSDGGFAPVRRS